MDLDGIRVLDLTQLLPGPYGSQLLADVGAEVIKVEPPGGDHARAATALPGWAGYVFPAVNNGKKSITLDLKTDAGRTAFYELVDDADVVFEQFRPGVVDRLCIDYETLSEYNGELIYCSLSGYGQAGPSQNRVGHDINYAGVAGLLDMTRDSEADEPTVPGYPIADMTGGLVAATSIVSALLSRELGNTDGNYIDVSLTDAVCSHAQVELLLADDGQDPRPGETTLTGGVPWYDIYETKDGRYVTLGALEPRFWRTFCEAIGRPDLNEHHMTDDEETREWLRAELTDIFASRTRKAWETQFGDHDKVPFGVVNTPAEALDDPQLQERGVLEATADGHRRVGFPARVAKRAASGDGPPDLGEHTDELLANAGFDTDEIATLRDDGVI